MQAPVWHIKKELQPSLSLRPCTLAHSDLALLSLYRRVWLDEAGAHQHTPSIDTTYLLQHQLKEINIPPTSVGTFCITLFNLDPKFAKQNENYHLQAFPKRVKVPRAATRVCPSHQDYSPLNIILRLDFHSMTSRPFQ